MASVPRWVLERKQTYAAAFRRAGLDKVAANLEDCSEMELLLACSNCNHRRYVVFHCESRVCPICSFHLAQDRAFFVKKLLGQMAYPKMLTLTIPVRDEEPRETIKYLRSCFQKLRDRQVFAAVKGGAYQIEVKVKQGHFHIHMHIILDAPYIHYTQLYKAWADITECQGVQVDIRAAKTPAQQAYVVKYAQKAAELRADGSDVVRWYLAVKGSRLFGTFGAWYNTRIEDLLEPEELPPEPPPCPECGGKKTMYFARDGVFVYGKAWHEIKGAVITADFPVSRRIGEPVKPTPRQDQFLELMGLVP